jgi:hypothetical protein
MKTLDRFLLLITLCVTVGISAQNTQSDRVLHHVLLIKWAEDHDPGVKEEVLQLFYGLPDKIPGMTSFNMYPIEESSVDFDNVLIMLFSSEEALQAYQVHPDHELIKKIAPPLLSGFEEYDYWE